MADLGTLANNGKFTNVTSEPNGPGRVFDWYHSLAGTFTVDGVATSNMRVSVLSRQGKYICSTKSSGSGAWSFQALPKKFVDNIPVTIVGSYDIGSNANAFIYDWVFTE